jgi:hypothetical protein
VEHRWVHVRKSSIIEIKRSFGKRLQKLDSIQSEGGPRDPILLEALNGRFQFEKTHRYLKKFSNVNSCGHIDIWTKIHLNSKTV